MDILAECKKEQEKTVFHRRFLHTHAEVGLDLPVTQKYIVDELTSLGFSPRVFHGGVIAEVGESKTDEVFLLRADCDALPIREKTGLPFASKTGNMHACGHDLHASALLTASKIIKANARLLSRRVRFLFQFGEERLEGAKKAIEADVLEGVSGAFALHVATASPLPVGKYILAGTGEIAPYCDFFKTELQGKSAHGSTPELGTDALLAGAQFINALCQIPARETSPAKPAVLTAGTFRAGDAPNAIAQSAIIEGTLRAWDKNTQTRLLERIKTIASCIAKSCHAKAKFTRTGGCPALKNDPVLREKTARLITENFGKTALISADGQKGGGSEDFAFISQKVPSVFVAVSAGRDEDGYIYPLHHAKANFDERVLPHLSALFCAWALQKI